MVNLLPQLWQLTQPASVVEAQYSSYRISAFTLANSNTVATLVGEVALSLTSNFTIARPFQQTIINDDTSYIIAIRYTDTQGITYRYVLFDANGVFAIQWADYAGEVLGAGAVLEIWANPDETVIASSDDIVFYFNTLTPYSVTSPPPCACNGSVVAVSNGPLDSNPTTGSGTTPTPTTPEMTQGYFDTVADMLASTTGSWDQALCYNWNVGDGQITEWTISTIAMTPSAGNVLFMDDGNGYAVRTPQA